MKLGHIYSLVALATLVGCGTKPVENQRQAATEDSEIVVDDDGATINIAPPAEFRLAEGDVSKPEILPPQDSRFSFSCNPVPVPEPVPGPVPGPITQGEDKKPVDSIIAASTLSVTLTDANGSISHASFGYYCAGGAVLKIHSLQNGGSFSLSASLKRYGIGYDYLGNAKFAAKLGLRIPLIMRKVYVDPPKTVDVAADVTFDEGRVCSQPDFACTKEFAPAVCVLTFKEAVKYQNQSGTVIRIEGTNSCEAKRSTEIALCEIGKPTVSVKCDLLPKI
jgi:hypothetical protein